MDNCKNIIEPQLDDELVERIKVYRKRFNLDSSVSDKFVIELIENFRWLAKLYITEFKHKSPEDILRKLKVGYNEDADNNRDE